MTATADRKVIENIGGILSQEEHLDAIAATVIDRILVNVPGYSGLTADSVAPLIKRQVGLLVAGIVSGSKPAPRSFKEVWVQGGEERASQGVPLEDMLHGWRIGLDVTHQRIRAIAAEIDAPPAVLLELLEVAMRWTDAGMLSGAAGHREAELEVARQQRDYRVNFLRRVLSGGLSAEDLRSAAGHSINRNGLFHAVRARPKDDQDALRIQRALQPGQSADQRDGLIASIDGDICGFVAALPSRCGATVGASPALPLTEMARGFRLATRALDVGLAIGTKGMLRFDDLGALPAVKADDEVSAALVARYIEPIEGLGQSADAILETVEQFIRNGLRHDQTAKDLFVHVNTVRYRVGRFEEICGRSLRDGDTIVTAWWALTYRRLSREA